ncbi:MFS transporter [Alicyclobacillus fastidiosus]|uniref:MFS transporter n=1 Tax=Alicyclobacillus fastidiosus TaxID=392011 RepID=A0ABY6ZHF6_9BACL|nr:MFS transporter [Alicyclobacillus fastidiosus]WAH41546.1 MFS transporter [Alicyclobacillus fastidiosus]GMA63201.1 MFS transporter [Alicyclobacillus fastidiosus]
MSTQQKELISRRYPWMVLSVTSLGVLLTLLNVGTLNVALPVVSRHFHATAITANWILLSYMLFNTVFILIFGRLADMFGRRRLYIIGLSAFTIVSLLIGFAPNIWVLLVLRVVQAAGGAIVVTNTTPLLTDAFPEKSLPKGLGINVLVASVAQLVGPVVGGFFASVLGWQWVFWFNVPFGVIGVIWAMITLRSMPSTGTREAFDLPGNILIFFALGGAILALSEGSTLGWGNPIVVAGLLAFVILTPIFLHIEWRAKSPLMDLRLFGQRRYAMAYTSAFLNSFARSAVVLLMALYYQTLDHASAFTAGLAVLPVTAGMLLLSPVAGSLASRYDARLLSSLGLALSGLGVLVLIFEVGPASSFAWAAVGMFLVGAGTALFMTPNTSSIMTTIDPAHRGTANGLRSMLQNMGQVVSTALSLMLVTASLPPRLQASIYGGNAVALPQRDVHLIVVGFRTALFAMLIATLIGVLTSLVRGQRKHAQAH